MSLEPFSIIETTPGAFSLLLRNLDTLASAFEAAGHTGNGYSWQALAQHVLDSDLPELVERIEFDSEADMFCAFATDRGSLERLGEHLATLARHPKSLTKAIAAVPSSAWDD